MEIKFKVEVVDYEDIQRIYADHVHLYSLKITKSVGLDFVDIGKLSEKEEEKMTTNEIVTIERKPVCRIVLSFELVKKLSETLNDFIKNYNE